MTRVCFKSDILFEKFIFFTFLKCYSGSPFSEEGIKAVNGSYQEVTTSNILLQWFLK